MFYFTSRRVSCSAVFVWSAAVLLSSMPSGAGAVPIEARLAEIVGMNHNIVSRGCGVHACKTIVDSETKNNGENESESEDTSGGLLSTAPKAAVSDPVSNPSPPATESEEKSEGSSTDAPEEQQAVPSPVANLQSTGAATSLSPVLTWAIAGTAGVALAMF